MGTILLSFQDAIGLTGDARPRVVLCDAATPTARKAWNNATEAFATPPGEPTEDEDFFVYADEDAVFEGFYGASIAGVTGDWPAAEVIVLKSSGLKSKAPTPIVDGESVSLTPPTAAEIAQYLAQIIPGNGPSNIVRIEPARTWRFGDRRLGSVVAEETLAMDLAERNILFGFDLANLSGTEFQNVAAVTYTPDDGALDIGIVGAQNGRRFAISITPSAAKDYVVKLQATNKAGELVVAAGALQVTDGIG